MRRRGRYSLLADIAECYRSVYTHAIAWCLEGRDIAQTRPNDYQLLGNRIDRAVRNAQGRQTNGIPVGPDTSLVLAELVLADLDRRLVTMAPPLAGLRYYDDYELTYATLEDAEHATAVLGAVARDYGLHLNLQKTTIRELPISLEEEWNHRVRSFDFGRGQLQRARLFEFFDYVFRIKAAMPASNIVAFALARLAAVRLEESVWPVLQPLLLQSAYAEPAAIQQFFRTIEVYFRMGRLIDETMLEEFVADMILKHGPLGHSFEVAWAMWGAIRFDVPLSLDVGQVVSQNWDSVSALLALHARSRGLFGSGSLDDSGMQAAINKNPLRSQHWLLAYEAVVQQWLPPPTIDHIGQDSVFSHFRTSRVRFYKRFHRARTFVDGDLADAFDWDPDGDGY